MPERLLRGAAFGFGILGGLFSRNSLQLPNILLRDGNVSWVGQHLRRRAQTVGEGLKILGVHHAAHTCEAPTRDRQQRLESSFRSENKYLP